MSRIRTIKPEFWGHPKVSRVSRDARLLFLGLLNESDDEGRLLGSTKRLAGVVFPHDDDVTARKVEKWLDELQSVCLIFRYEVSGTPYIFLPGFTEHQKVSHPTPSRLPIPSGGFQETFVPDLGREQGTGKGVSAGKNSGAPEDDLPINEIVAAFVDDWRVTHSNHDPPREFRGACGKAVKSALKNGESREDIQACLGVIAKESKNPSALAYVLADKHAGRPRRRQ